MESHLVPFYSCIFAIYYFVLSVRVIKARRRFYVPLGDGTLEYLAFIELERWKTQSSLSSNDQGKAIQKPHLSCRPLNLAGFHEVQRKVRAHANFVEYVPFTLLLLFFVEINNHLSSSVLHGICITSLAGRVVHSEISFSKNQGVNVWRPVGMALTFGPLILSALINGFYYIMP